ncbi:MAG: hypothetical protein JW774_10740 [Candidatus Aureabacteria bacterium]|nr:hypothetical protein [Candidatus Auribacterota bacterium]
MKRKEQPPKQFWLVLDENLSGHSIYNVLKKENLSVKQMIEFADRGASDEVLIRLLTKHKDCYLLTRDGDFRYKPSVKAALMESNLGVFVITSSGSKTGSEIAVIIIKAWKRIEKFIKKNKKPFVGKISSDGYVSLS